MKLFALFAFLVLFTVPFASAGTLISGSDMEVKSNFQGLNGLSLVGTWSTSPTVNDRVTISNLIIPDPYEIKSTADLTFNQPKFEQVFEIVNQERVLKVTVVDKSFYYFAVTPSGADADCEAAWTKYRAETELNKELFSGFDPVRLSGGFASCRVLWLTTEQTGFVGKVQDDRIFYSQDIVLSNSGTMHLERSDKMDSLVATIPGVARAVLLDFNMYTNVKLTDNNIYAFQTKSSSGAGSWRTFSNIASVTQYQQADTSLSSLDDQFLSQSISADTFKNQVSLAAANLNTAGSNLAIVSQTLPEEWKGKYNGAPRIESSNLIIVEPKRDTFTANIQVAVRGEKFGLFIPTGECTINTVDSKEQWLETSQGQLAYSVKNTGTDTASLSLSATCTGSNINAVPQDVELPAGSTKTGNLVLTGRTTTLDTTQQFACTFVCLEKNTQQKDTQAFTAVLERKQLCSEGEQTAPKLIGTDFVVEVLNSNCQVKATIACPALTGTFKQVDGVWKCEQKDDDSVIPAFPCPDGQVRDSAGVCQKRDEDNFSPGVLIVALIIGVIGGGIIYAYTGIVERASPRYGKLFRILIAVAVFIGGFNAAVN